MGANFIAGLVGAFGQGMLGEETRLHQEKLDRSKAKADIFRLIMQKAVPGTPQGDAMIKVALQGISSAESEKGDVGLGEVFGRGRGKKGKNAQQPDEGGSILERITGMIGGGLPGGNVGQVTGTPPFVGGGSTQAPQSVPRGTSSDLDRFRTPPFVESGPPLSVPDVGTYSAARGATEAATGAANGALAISPMPAPSASSYSSPFGDPLELEERRVRKERELQKEFRVQDLDDAMKRINAAKSSEEKQVIAGMYGIHLLAPHLQHVVVTTPDGQPVPAAFDPTSGQYLNPDTGQPIPGAKPYEKKLAADRALDQLADAYRGAINPNASQDEARKWAQRVIAAQQIAKISPTTTTGTREVIDPITGERTRLTSQSTRAKFGLSTSAAKGTTATSALQPTGKSESDLRREAAHQASRLSQQAKSSLETIQSGVGMMDRLEESLKPLSEDNSLQAKAKLEWEWGKYIAGFQVDPPYDQIIPTAALLRVQMTTPYLRGLRNFNYVRQIQQHLPGPTDTPKLMMQKIAQLRANVPLLQEAIYATEQPNRPKNKDPLNLGIGP